MINGCRDVGLSDGAYGSWTTLSGGYLDGLTLTTLFNNPSGTHVGTAAVNYRYLGNTEDNKIFLLSHCSSRTKQFVHT